MSDLHEDPNWRADYCDYCEREGHTFRSCPARDDTYEDDE